MPFLEMGGVRKSFGRADAPTEVLRDINLDIRQGEFVAIVGYSGAGKTTLISLLAGLIAPDAGTITLRGQPVTAPGADRGVIFQNYSLLPWLSVAANVKLAVDQAFPRWTDAQRRAHVERYIGMVNLSHAKHKTPRELSGGMRQRVSVARALAVSPQVLLMDEPLSALDALTRATLQEEIVRIWEQDRKTAVLITNDVDEGILMADRIIPLSAGPGATLGPSLTIDIPRPRDRKEINHHPRFKEIRREVIAYLMATRKNVADASQAIRPLPQLVPAQVATRGGGGIVQRVVRRLTTLGDAA
ncbi:MAG: ABC transporter ATP-binding protein [Tepidisphaeraceae bacterium]